MADKKNKGKNEALFTRHSIASYNTYSKTVGGENPRAAHDIHNQVVPDVPDSEKRNGVQLAREQAEKLFAEFNPEKDALFFVSSNEARALETAYYYVNVAQEMGFDIIEHKKGWFATGRIKFPTVEKVKKHTGNVKNYVRPIEALSLKIPDTFESMVFNSKRAMSHVKINWEALSQDDKIRWEQAREIVEKDDHGSWGPNFYFHSNDIKKIFPSIDTAVEAHQGQFQNLMRLVKWGLKKADDAKYTKNIKVIGFGHENYWGIALQEYLGDHSIGNCETVAISVDEGDITLERRGNWNSLSK